MKIANCPRIFSWPTYSDNALGRSARSNASSCGEAGSAAIRRSVSMAMRYFTRRGMRPEYSLRGYAHGLRQMIFDDEAKCLCLLDRFDLCANGFLQPFVRDLRNQIFNFGHKLT